MEEIKKTLSGKVFVYGKKTKETIPCNMKYAGFKMENKYAFYIWNKKNKTKSLVYFSKTSLLSNIKNGNIKV